MPALRSRSGRWASAVPGRLLALGVLLGSCGAGLAYTSEPERMWDALGQVGFELKAIKLNGQTHTSDSAIIAALGLGPGVTLLGLDVDKVRARLEGLPWVRAATVRKTLPGTLNVTIEEAEAFARWRYHGREVLIDRDGAVLTDDVPYEFRDLPLVAGRSANEGAAAIRDVLIDHPEFDARTTAAIFVNTRRWDLRLDNGATVRLPAQDASTSLTRLASLEEEGSLLGVGKVVVDLRLPDRTTVQLNAPRPSDSEGELPHLPNTAEPADPLAAAIAEATSAVDDPLARAIAEAVIP